MPGAHVQECLKANNHSKECDCTASRPTATHLAPVDKVSKRCVKCQLLIANDGYINLLTPNAEIIWSTDPTRCEAVYAHAGIKLPPRESVDHPSHYGGKDNAYEAIKVIHAWKLGFDLGNAVKYISRAGKKDPSKEIEDLKKAIWYIESHINLLKANGS